VNKSDTHLMEEIVEHMILEKKGILAGDHFLPKSMPKDKVKPKVKKKGSGVWFYIIGLGIIFAELWYIDLYLSMKFPNLFNG